MPPYAATRRNGICRGSLYKQHLSVAIPPSMTSTSFHGGVESNERRSKSHDYCALIGNTLSSYPSLHSYYRGDFPISEVRIVGASAWNPQTQNNSSSSSSGGLFKRKNDTSGSSTPNQNSTSFRIVTYAGTHLYCSAPTLSDRDTWLAALHSGLEASYALYHETLLPSKNTCIKVEKEQEHYSSLSSPSQQLLTPPPKQIQLQTHRSIPASPTPSSSSSNAMMSKYCISCGKAAYSIPTSSSNSSTNTLNTSTTSSSNTNSSNTSTNTNSSTTKSSSFSSSSKYIPFCPSSAPLPQYGIEFRTDLCQSCLTSQGILSHVTSLVGLYASHAHERAALQAAQKMAVQTVERAMQEELHHPKIIPSLSSSLPSSPPLLSQTTHHSSNPSMEDLGGSWTTISSSEKSSRSKSPTSLPPKSKSSSPPPPTTTNNNIPSVASSTWLHLPPPDVGTKALLCLIQTPGFATFRRRARTLEVQCRRLEQGTIGGASEFLELLADTTNYANLHHNSSEMVMGGNVAQLKKEAFKVAGDMSAAIKLLSEHALPSVKVGDASEFFMGNELLAMILEFMVDLCEEGELAAVAFFWPQLRHIHLRMLPAKDADALVRVELMEDFLLTVCARFSVHLGLELVWGLIADLEESLQDVNASAICRARRFPVIRFVCEMESTLFGFDGGWGGGILSLRGILSPSEHQGNLIRDAVAVLQLHRRYSGHHLSRSVRVERLKREAERDFGQTNDITPTIAGDNPMEIREKANFFRLQLQYAKRLGDIAEKLRFMDVDKRSAALEKELNALNQGKMGGDPLSRAEDGLSLVVRLPSKEGHVFRSKERTPILLLMEVLRPDVDECDESDMEETIETIDEEKNERAENSTNPPPPPPIEIPNSSSDQDVEKSPKPLKRSSVIKRGSSTPKARALKRLSTNSNDDAEVQPNHETSDKEMKEMMAEAVQHQLALKDSLMLPSTNDESISTDLEKTTITNDESAVQESSLPEVSESSPQKKESKRIVTQSVPTKKMSALGSFGMSATDSQNGQSTSLSAFGEGRREVLTTILARGMRGDTVARGATKGVQRTVQEMDRERAEKLIMDFDENDPNTKSTPLSRINSTDDLSSRPGSMHGDDANTTSIENEENEAVESLRLLLIQNRQVTKSPEQDETEENKNEEDDDILGKGVNDAGEIDPRLLGCGPLSPAIVNAIKMWKDGIVSNGEVLELVQKDLQFFRHAVLTEDEMATKLVEDSAFWVRFAFGERWAEKKARIAATSPFGAKPGWDLVGCIVKSNDDLRQEAFVMQLIELCQEAFDNAGLELWVQPYRILATSRTTGIIETVRNAISFDGLKKRPGYGNGGLRGHLIRMTEFDADPKAAFNNVQRNFVRSLAAYSLMSYFFMFKDRHNGNLLLDTAGHVIHIDFGFVFGIAPGGSFSLEMSTPFKLTEEMLEVMDGPGSPLFSEFVTLFCCGFLALQNHVDTFCTVVEITCKGSNFNCFEGKDHIDVVEKMRNRFAPNLNKAATIAFALDLINQATSSYGTKQYDFFQYLSQGIAA